MWSRKGINFCDVCKKVSLVCERVSGCISVQSLFLLNFMYLLTKWEGRMGKYLAWGHAVRNINEILMKCSLAEYTTTRVQSKPPQTFQVVDHWQGLFNVYLKEQRKTSHVENNKC